MLLWRVNAKGFGGKVQLVSWCQARAFNGFQYLAGVLWIGKNKTTLNCLDIKSLSDSRYCGMVWLKGTWPSFSINCYSTLFYHYISWHFTFRGPKFGGRHEILHSYFHLFFVIFFSFFFCVCWCFGMFHGISSDPCENCEYLQILAHSQGRGVYFSGSKSFST